MLHAAGIDEAAKFDWLDKPDANAVAKAESLLRSLGALAKRLANGNAGGLTDVGRAMLRRPMHPRLARMIVEGSRRGCVNEAALCAAFMSGRNILIRSARDDKTVQAAQEPFRDGADSDFEVMMRAWQFANARRYNVDDCRAHGIHAGACREVESAFRQILHLAKATDAQAAPDRSKSTALRHCILAAFADQLCVRRDSGTLFCNLTDGRSGTLVRESVVQKSPLLVIGEIRQVSARGDRAQTLLSLAAAVELDWVRELFPGDLTTRAECGFDPGMKRVEAHEITRFRDLELGRARAKEADPQAAGQALAKACLGEWFTPKSFDHSIRQLIRRLNWLCAARPDLEFPPLDETAILNCLSAAFAGMTLAKQAVAADVKPAFRKHMPSEQWEWLDEFAPQTIPWLDDKPKRLEYPDKPADKHGNMLPVELHVKLHDCFRLAEHPRICDGEHIVRFKLLTPKNKKIDFCEDWPTFKQREYPRIRKDLLARFPGVGWV